MSRPLLRKAGGVACVVLGVGMLLTPGPGLLMIYLGLRQLGVVGG